MVIGIIGGVGSGKSTVLDYLANNYNAHIIQADIVAKEIMEPGYSAYNEICDAFPDAIDNSGINKEKLANIVFNNKEKLILLNSITHPATIEEIISRITKSTSQDSDKKNDGFKSTDYSNIIVVESAILPGTGIEDYCDELWYVYCEKEKRITRLMNNRGYSREKAESIIANQPSEEEYNRMADEFIDNSYSENETHEKIDIILSLLPCSF